jgi:hypothetical protein
MTTQIIQKKHVHLNVFTKNQGRTAALPCLNGIFAPAYKNLWDELGLLNLKLHRVPCLKKIQKTYI